LFREIDKISQELGYWKIRLNADPSDVVVRKFYESLGFKDNRNNGFFEKDVA